VSASTVNVLMVDSVNDDITQRRHRALSLSGQLRHIVFEYCYAADLDERQESMLRAGMLPRVTLNEDSLCAKIEEAIQRFRPQYVLLHTGFVYRQHPDVFVRVFSRLKRTYLGVMFGVQLRPGMFADPQAFHTSAPVVALQRLIFDEVLGNP